MDDQREPAARGDLLIGRIEVNRRTRSNLEVFPLPGSVYIDEGWKASARRGGRGLSNEKIRVGRVVAKQPCVLAERKNLGGCPRWRRPGRAPMEKLAVPGDIGEVASLVCHDLVEDDDIPLLVRGR